MPHVEVTVGGRIFEVACQEGEEPYLRNAAGMLDAEAVALSAAIGRMPEAKMLLMAGLMLADKAVGLEDRVREAETRMAEMARIIDQLENAPRETITERVEVRIEVPVEKRVEVPVIPEDLRDRLLHLAARAEELAEEADNG